MNEREAIGKGWEHEVLRSKNERWVLKKPRMATLICLRLLAETPSDLLNEEIKSNSERLRRNGILFPETKMFTFGKGYIIAQKIVDEDNSLNSAEKKHRLLQTEDPYLLDLFTRDSNNFHSNNGNLYLLDLTYGFNRILDKLGIVSIEKQKHITALLFPDHSVMGSKKADIFEINDSVSEVPITK